MTAYRIEFLPSARRDLAALPKDIQRRIARRIDSLSDNPRPSGGAVLRGEEGLVRIRVGDYRVIYQVNDPVFSVLVAKIGHRRQIYKRR